MVGWKLYFGVLVVLCGCVTVYWIVQDIGTTLDAEEEETLPTVVVVPVTTPSGPRKPWINFPLSVTSNGLKMRIRRFDELPLFTYALRTLITTAEPWLFTYDIIVGVDADDPWYTTSGNVTAMGEWWTQQWQAVWPGHPVPGLAFHVYANTASRNVWAVNYAAQHAYEAGADYFYRINDDTELHKNNWSSVFVATLASFKPFPGCGVVAPRDPFPKRDLMTHSFVGRCHFAIFGVYFPPTFHNYFSDDWVGAVYASLPASFGKDAVMAKILDHITVRHVVLPERYERMATTALYEQQLAIDRVRLREYGEKKIKQRSP